MDSNVLIAGIFSIVGAIVGAWLNPQIQEWREKRKLKRFIKKCSNIEKFIIFNAYKMTFLPIGIISNEMIFALKEQDRAWLNNFMLFLRCLDIAIQRLKEERKIFAKYEENNGNKGYAISLYTDMSSFIADNKNIKNQLMQETKKLIADNLYPCYKHTLLQDTIYTKLDNQTLLKFILFMTNINVFYLHNKDISHLDFKNQKSYLELPKGEMHPEYKN